MNFMRPDWWPRAVKWLHGSSGTSIRSRTRSFRFGGVCASLLLVAVVAVVADGVEAQGVPHETANCRLEGTTRALAGPDLPKSSAACLARCLSDANHADENLRCAGYNFIATDESQKTGYIEPIGPPPPNWVPGTPLPLPQTACELLRAPLSFGRSSKTKANVYSCILPCNSTPAVCGMATLQIEKPESPKGLPLVEPANRLPPVKKEIPSDIRR